MRPTHASQAVSSIVVISVMISSERAGALGSMPTALPNMLARCSLMATCISRREDLHPSGFRLLRSRQIQVMGQEVTRCHIIVALFAHAFKHVGVLSGLGILRGQARNNDDLFGEICFRH